MTISPLAAPRTITLNFENAFARLPPAFYTHLRPTGLQSPFLIAVSAPAAALIGLSTDDLNAPGLLDVFSGARVADGSQPLAAVYSGHQFGVWAGQLGDGRAILLGDVPQATRSDGVANPAARLELQLKGAGATPYSRMGDGRAVLRSSIREYLCSEAMAGLGIPTTRALCIVGSEQRVMREAPEKTAIVTRMAPSFVRFGSFEHWYYNDQKEYLRTLADAVISHHFPEFASTPNPYQSLLTEVTRRTASLIAQWQAVGFMHGVLNTDNMSILGLTLDYGPFGFMDAFDPAHICNHTDQQGRYAYHQQPNIGLWNCYALGQAMLPLIGSVESVHAALEAYQPEYDRCMQRHLQAKLGLSARLPDDGALIDAMFSMMQRCRTDFTLFFRHLGSLRQHDRSADQLLRDLCIDPGAFDTWAEQYRARLALQETGDVQRQLAMDRINPKYVLRNYLAQVAIERAEAGDFTEIETLRSVLARPFDTQPESEAYAALPPDWAAQLEVSCSS